MKSVTDSGQIKMGQRFFKKAFALFFFILAIATFLSLKPRTSFAAPGQHSATLGIGQVMLMGDYAKNFSDSIGLHAMYTYEASALLGLQVELAYSSHSNASGSNSLGIKGISPDVRFNLAQVDRLVVFAFTGFGLFMIDEKISTVQASAITLGFNVGAAVNLALSNHFQFGTSLAFNNIFGKTDQATVTDTSPGISVGGSYLSLFLNVSYAF